jgi:hypothetical protein
LRCPRPRTLRPGGLRGSSWPEHATRHVTVTRGLPLPTLPASPYALLPTVTSLLYSSEATVEPPLAPIKPPLFPPRALARRRARLALPPASIATTRRAPPPLAPTVDRPLRRLF